MLGFIECVFFIVFDVHRYRQSGAAIAIGCAIRYTVRALFQGNRAKRGYQG